MSFARDYYSVPYPHVGAKVDLRVTESLLEMHRGHQWLSSHVLWPETVVNAYRTNDADVPAGPKYRRGARARSANGSNESAPRRWW